jgi:2-iminobutanoate/2-iminopropanoate deaminase
MTVKMIHSNQAPQPVGPYSQATQVGNLMFISGLIPIKPETNTLELYEGNAAKQCDLILTTLKNFLHSQERTLKDVAKTTIFVSNMDDFASVNDVYGRYFNEHKPARACVEVSRLPKDVAVEIEAIVDLT